VNQKKVGYDGPRPTYLKEVKVNGRRLVSGMHATLLPPPGRKENRRYEFKYAEMLQGELMLTFDGPVRGVRRYRNVRPSAVVTVHSKSEAR
jgi:hypothetical protein